MDSEGIQENVRGLMAGTFALALCRLLWEGIAACLFVLTRRRREQVVDFALEMAEWPEDELKQEPILPSRW